MACGGGVVGCGGGVVVCGGGVVVCGGGVVGCGGGVVVCGGGGLSQGKQLMHLNQCSLPPFHPSPSPSPNIYSPLHPPLPPCAPHPKALSGRGREMRRDRRSLQGKRQHRA